MEDQNTQNNETVSDSQAEMNQSNQTDMGANQEQENTQSEQPQEAPKMEQPVQQDSSNSVGDAKLWGIIGYIIPILFFVPLVMDDLKNNSYAKFHANQQLVLLISWIVVNVVGGIIPFLGWFIILPIGTIILIILAIIGIINAAQGVEKKLPMIGGISILK